MEDRKFRKPNPCTAYERQGRTKQNVYECYPTERGLQGDCRERSNRGRERVKPDIYDCCPPTPVVLKCSVCSTAECEGANVWNQVPFVSYSDLSGPTLADLLVYILNLLPMSFLAWIGIAHPRSCPEKIRHPVRSCSSERTPPMNIPRCPPGTLRTDKRDPKVPCPCPPTHPRTKAVINHIVNEGGGEQGHNMDPTWMYNVCEATAQQLAEVKRFTSEDSGDMEYSRDLDQARNYVLDTLTEMLVKYEEIKKKHQLKKQNG